MAEGPLPHLCLRVLCPIPCWGPVPLPTTWGCLRSPEERGPEAGGWSRRGGGSGRAGLGSWCRTARHNEALWLVALMRISPDSGSAGGVTHPAWGHPPPALAPLTQCCLGRGTPKPPTVGNARDAAFRNSDISLYLYRHFPQHPLVNILPSVLKKEDAHVHATNTAWFIEKKNNHKFGIIITLVHMMPPTPTVRNFPQLARVSHHRQHGTVGPSSHCEATAPGWW